MSRFLIRKPSYDIESTYFGNYVRKAKEEDLISSLKLSQKNTVELYQNLTEENGNFAYAEGKWTIKQVLQHLIDTERVFCYRALRISRNDKTEMNGYDENQFADYDNSQNRTLESILKEFQIVREATILLFESFSEIALDYVASAGDNLFTPRVIGWMLSGHNDHHNNVLKERYL